MSTQNRTNAKTKAPVSSHPLFPAIVALWFGALFGLGSLAVRPSLIESLVISSHLDVIVPMAAPPLGMTARILLALFMAMIGIVGGAVIARRIARPKPVARNRRRTAGSVSDTDGDVRKSAFVREVQAQQFEQRIAADKADAMRRRALAAEDTNCADSHRDEAPLPGGAPQILDVTQFDLAAPGSFEADLAKETASEAPLDLTGFAAPQNSYPQPAEADPVEQPMLTEEPLIEPAVFAAPAPVLESYGDDTDSFRAKFANEKKPVEWTPEPPPGYAETFDAIDVAEEALELTAEPADLAADLAAPRRFDPVAVEAAVQPLDQTDFALQGSDLTSPAVIADEPAEFPQEPAAPEVEAAVATPELRRFDGPASFAQAGEIEAVAPIAAPVAAPAPFLPEGTAAERIASANLAELSPVELVERFALALKQRRHTGAFPAGLLETAAALDLPVRQQPSQVPEILAAMAPIAEPVVAAVPEAPEAPQTPELPEPPEPIAAATPLFAASAPVSSEIDDAPVAPIRLPLTLPVAMRPIEFGHHEEHDDLPDYVPPRSFAMPRPGDEALELSEATEVPADDQPKHRLHLEFDWRQNNHPSPKASPETILEGDPQAVPGEAMDTMRQAAAPSAENPANAKTGPGAETEAEADVNEEGYSSLLALTKTAPLRQTFVRIEEPASELSQVEPVVIFPGQATRPGTRFSRPSENAAPAEPQAEAPQFPAELPQASAPGLRRFDAPTAAAPSATPAANAVQDPAETERALRSALATLQRMSGAA